MKNASLVHRLILATFAILLLLLPHPTAAQSEVRAYISSVDCSAFPTISLTVRAVDAQGRVITDNLDTASFALFDNATQVTQPAVMATETGAKHVIFSVDRRGENTNLEKYQAAIRNIMSEFTSQYVIDDTDIVSIVSHISGSKPDVVLQPTSNKTDVLNAISALSFARISGTKSDLSGLEAVFNDLVTQKPGRRNTVIFHFSRFLETPSAPLQQVDPAKNLGAKMASENIRVYTFQTETSGDARFYRAFQELAASSQGAYLLIDKPGYEGELARIFREVEQGSKVFRLQFTSTAYVADHTISLAAPGAGPERAMDSRTCIGIDIQDPQVAFDYPPNSPGLKIQLKPDDTSITVRAHVDWPDKKPRTITTAELLVNGTVIETKTDLPPTDPLYFIVSTDDLLASKSLANIALEVRVADAWGRSASNWVSFDLSAAPTPVVTPTAAPRPTTEGPVIVVAPGACDEGLSVNCIKAWVISNWILLLILVVVGGMFLVMFILLIATRHQLAKLSAPAREAIGKRAAQVRDQVRKTLLGGASHQQQAVAYLNVLVARSDRVGSKIEIYNNRTTLGRDPSLTDVQLYNPEDKTSVSGLHCTIFYDPGQGKFFITDDNSTNGSFLNGKRLPSNEPHELKENDEITLGDIYRQGAKLRFELAAGQPAHSIEDEMIPIENDFNVDLDGSGSYANEVTQAAVDSMPPPPPPQPKKEMSDETIPGYRDEDILSYPEQPAAPPPGRPANKPPQKKGKDKSWIDDLS